MTKTRWSSRHPVILESPMSAVTRLAGLPAVRRAAEAVLTRWYAGKRVGDLDRSDPAAVQRRTLLKLVRYAAGTRFGRDHDFGRVRSVADYQARVPLRHYEEFWRDYWEHDYPRLRGVTWPDFIPYYALSSGTTSGN